MNPSSIKKVTAFAHYREGASAYSDFFIKYFARTPGVERVYVKFPFVYSKNGSIRVEKEKDGSPFVHESLVKFYKPEPLSYMKDFIYALYYGIRFARHTDLLIATTNLLALAGIILRFFKVVKKVVYVTIDYTPRRYSNPFLNSLYFFIDELASYHADKVWALSQRMIDGKIRDGRLIADKVRSDIVPYGNRSNEFSDQMYSKFNRYSIAFFGGVLKSKGAELFVPIIQALRKKGRKEFVFHCIGAGDVEELRAQVSSNGLDDAFKIYGLIEDVKLVDEIMFTCGVAIAPYYPHDQNNFSYYADPGKIKEYVGWGLPVVITDVPPIVPELIQSGAGLIAEYSAGDFADKILHIVEDEKRYLQYRKNSRAMGNHYSWTSIFERGVRGL